MVQAIAELRIGLGAALVIALLGVAGCVPPEVTAPSPPARTPVAPAATVAKPPASEPAPAPEAAVTVEPSPPPPPVRTAPPVSPAAQALLAESRSYQGSGNFEQAAASIERALRIDPRQPVLWLELGNIRLQEGDYAQAESMGRKALSLASGDAAIAAHAERLINEAKLRE